MKKPTQRPLIRNAADRERVRKWLLREIQFAQGRRGKFWDAVWTTWNSAVGPICGPRPAPKKKPAARRRK